MIGVGSPVKLGSGVKVNAPVGVTAHVPSSGTSKPTKSPSASTTGLVASAGPIRLIVVASKVAPEFASAVSGPLPLSSNKLDIVTGPWSLSKSSSSWATGAAGITIVTVAVSHNGVGVLLSHMVYVKVSVPV